MTAKEPTIEERARSSLATFADTELEACRKLIDFLTPRATFPVGVAWTVEQIVAASNARRAVTELQEAIRVLTSR